MVAISVVRMMGLDPAAKDPDRSSGTWLTTILTIIEVNLAVICASLREASLLYSEVF